MATGEPKKNKGGRPKGSTKKADPFRIPGKPGRPEAMVPDEKTLKALNQYGQAGITIERMAAYQGVSLTAFNNFRKKWPEADEAIEQGRAKMDLAISLAQIDVAIKKKNPQMLIWLGKQRLGQSDKVEQRTGEIAVHIDADDAQV